MIQTIEDVTITIPKTVKHRCPCYVGSATDERTLYKVFYLDTIVHETIKGATLYIKKQTK